MSNNESTKPGEPEKAVSDYAPKGQVAQQKPAENGVTEGARVYLTAAMIAPEGDVNRSDGIRIAKMMGPAIDQIGKSAADKIELNALTIVENARNAADVLFAEAKAQSEEMVSRAEATAADLRDFAKSIRRYTDRKAFQVQEFCAVHESIIATMHSLGDQFKSASSADEAAEKEEQENPEELGLPSFLNRNRKLLTDRG